MNSKIKTMIRKLINNSSLIMMIMSQKKSSNSVKTYEVQKYATPQKKLLKKTIKQKKREKLQWEEYHEFFTN